MAFRPDRWLSHGLRERAAEQWRQIAAQADGIRGSALRDLRDEAGDLREVLSRFLQRTDRRVGRSRAALNALHLPPGTDWRWRPDVLSAPLPVPGLVQPESGVRLGDEVALWHDCPARAVMLRQVLNSRVADLAPFGLRLEVFGFSGNFMALSMDLPAAALEGLGPDHILRVETALTVEQPLNIYLRLNLEHGPSVEQLQNYLGYVSPDATGTTVAAFDLAESGLGKARLDKAWLDMIFEAPALNAIQIRELFASRHLRAGA